ncbi:MAG TPA: ABC transporter ATP-binding protein [Solirubrobacteraceae bacterium]|nr:ABC transporter ATP-binding protein [Solirubrobacteraceae bacterium]
MADVAISTAGLTKRYGSARGIEDVTLGVRRGEVFGFLGPNGAGKTTTIRTLLGLLRPTAGSASILGHDVWRDGVAARARTGFLPGEFAFDEQVTGEELLDLFADLRGVDDRAYARSLADRFEADLRRPLGELSRGNRQKVGLVQALVHRPPVVVMDEPTAGLDPLMQEEFAHLVGELRRDGATIFLSSHNLGEVERMCDRVGILRAGRLAAVESVEAIRSRALRHVRLRFDGPAPADEFAALPGVSGLHAAGPELRFLLAGEPTAVVRAAGRHRLRDVEIARPSLEEAFIAAYGHPDDGTAA